MVIVDAAWYEDGKRVMVATSINELAARRGKSNGFGWLGLRMPTEDEFTAIGAAFGIPKAALSDARHKHDRPKVEVHDDCLLTVVPTARYVDATEEVEFGELFFFTGSDYVVSVRYGHAAPLAGVRSELERDPTAMMHGPSAVLQAALLHVIDSYVPVLDGLENDIREVERDVFSDERAQPIRRIYFLAREVLDFLIALEPLSGALKRLSGTECNRWVDPEVVPMFADVAAVLESIVERGRNAHQLLSNALTASLTQVAMQQNLDMRRISAWVAIGVVPTAVAGLFGMNLGGIPGGSHVLGWSVVSVLTAVASVALYLRLKASNWL